MKYLLVSRRSKKNCSVIMDANNEPSHQLSYRIYFLTVNQDFNLGNEAQLCTSSVALRTGKGSEWFAGQCGGGIGMRSCFIHLKLRFRFSRL